MVVLCWDLTHYSLLMPQDMKSSVRRWFRWWPVVLKAQMDQLTQCWLINKYIFRNRPHLYLSQNEVYSFTNMHLKTSPAKLWLFGWSLRVSIRMPMCECTRSPQHTLIPYIICVKIEKKNSLGSNTLKLSTSGQYLRKGFFPNAGVIYHELNI